MAKFNLGEIVVTRGISDCMTENAEFIQFVIDCLGRHSEGDWGDLCEEDKKVNDDALLNADDRLVSSYDYPNKLDNPLFDNNIYVITEWDRSATTILFPSEY